MNKVSIIRSRKTILLILLVAFGLLINIFDMNTAYAHDKQPKTYIDSPTSNQKVTNQDILVRGWALNASGVKEVRISVDGSFIGNADIGLSRPDVDRAYPGYPGGAQSGYQYTLNVNSLQSGYNTITVEAVGNDGTKARRNTSVNIVKPQPKIYIDSPTSNQKVTNQDILVRGWALNASGVKEVRISVDGTFIGNADIGLSRPDVDRAYPGYPGGAQSGYQYTLNVNSLQSGYNTITVEAVGNDGTKARRNTSVNIVKPQPKIYIDSPTSNQKVTNQDILVRGWALNASGVKEVRISVDGSFIGNADIGLSRPDVDRAYPGYPGGAQSGYQYTLNVNSLQSGYNTITVEAVGNDGTKARRNTSVNIVKPQPKIYIDSPTSNQKVTNQDILVRGWALNASGVKEVRISVDGSFIGNADIGLSRPDVDRAYPGYPGGAQSGYQYTLNVNSLQSGYNTITVEAVGNDGTKARRNTSVNIVKPQPKIYIDSPTSNQKVTNQDILVRGWALNASGVKEVRISVDGTFIGNADIGLSRPDVDKAYPGYPGGTQSGYQYALNVNSLQSGYNTITVEAVIYK
jgi:uncharacterized protein YjiS (DUF1127 family)